MMPSSKGLLVAAVGKINRWRPDILTYRDIEHSTIKQFDHHILPFEPSLICGQKFSTGHNKWNFHPPGRAASIIWNLHHSVFLVYTYMYMYTCMYVPIIFWAIHVLYLCLSVSSFFLFLFLIFLLCTVVLYANDCSCSCIIHRRKL